MNFLANLLTFLSLFFGFTSVIYSLERQFNFAAWAIIFSVIFDGLDGQIARLNSKPSEFGKQFDSLVDAVAFGISPAILGYIFVRNGFNILVAVALFLYLGASVVRLAKYNITPNEKMAVCFYGLPTTASGGFLASLILLCRKYEFLPSPVLFLLAVVTLALLMVSKVRYLNLYGLKLVLNKFMVAVFVLILLVGVFFPEIVIFLLFSAYILFAPFVVKRLKAK